MKTNFPQRFKHRGLRRVILGVGAVIVVLILWGASYVGPVTSVIMSPLFSLRVWFAHTEMSIPSYIRTRHDLDEEVRLLKEQRDLAQASQDRVYALEEENALLRGLPGADTQGTDTSSRIVVDVVFRPNETPYDTLVVQGGSVDGVENGALVYVGTSVVGVVSRTFARSSLVTLFSTAGVVSPVYIYGPNIFAKGEGMGGGIMRISVPQGIAVSTGNPVIVPVKGSGVYGHVVSIESDVSKPEQYAFVAMEPSLSTLRFVTIDRYPMPTASIAEVLTTVQNAARDPLLAPLQSLLEILPVASSTASSTHP